MYRKAPKIGRISKYLLPALGRTDDVRIKVYYGVPGQRLFELQWKKTGLPTPPGLQAAPTKQDGVSWEVSFPVGAVPEKYYPRGWGREGDRIVVHGEEFALKLIRAGFRLTSWPRGDEEAKLRACGNQDFTELFAGA